MIISCFYVKHCCYLTLVLFLDLQVKSSYFDLLLLYNFMHICCIHLCLCSCTLEMKQSFHVEWVIEAMHLSPALSKEALCFSKLNDTTYTIRTVKCVIKERKPWHQISITRARLRKSLSNHRQSIVR